jgi:hypothetical protein
LQLSGDCQCKYGIALQGDKQSACSSKELGHAFDRVSTEQQHPVSEPASNDLAAYPVCGATITDNEPANPRVPLQSFSRFKYRRKVLRVSDVPREEHIERALVCLRLRRDRGIRETVAKERLGPLRKVPETAGDTAVRYHVRFESTRLPQYERTTSVDQ